MYVCMYVHSRGGGGGGGKGGSCPRQENSIFFPNIVFEFAAAISCCFICLKSQENRLID